MRVPLITVLVLTLMQSVTVAEVKITVDPSLVVGAISDDFIGFGYETSAVAQAHYFGGENKTLVQLYRNLSVHGLIRIGGCASDNTQYEPQGTPVAKDFRQVSVINQKNLADLGEFARATGWHVMWALNLGNGTKEQAVEEAVAVNAALGDHLQSLQIGNEVENLPRLKHSYPAYHDLYLDWKTAIRAAVPGVGFSGPDSVGHWEWVNKFADAESGDMKLITHHYYCSDAHDPKATVEKMLSRDDRFEKRLQQLQTLSLAKGVGYRINEVNSFSSGGKVGVSDTFASALWCLDYMYTLASNGCEGVNIETDINHLNFISHYSPIVHDPQGKCSVRPDYYGMLAFSLTGKGQLLKLTLDNQDINLTAYATRDSSETIRTVIINKEFAKDTQVDAPLPAGYKKADVLWLKAPAMNSTDQVTLAGAEVNENGSRTPQPAEVLAVTNGTIDITVPHGSAALLRFQK